MIAIVFNPNESELAAFVYAAAVVLAVLAFLHFVVLTKQRQADQQQSAEADGRETGSTRPPATTPPRPASRQGLYGLVVGNDNRLSTSKLQIFLWTITVVWAVLTLVFRFTGSESEAADAFTIQAEYLILLGFPATAGIVAKTLTMGRVQSGAIVKPPADSPTAADIVSNDEGDADLGDWQYLLFNIVALAVFYRLFLAEPDLGLPAIPETVVALTGGSAALYTVKKAQERQQSPSINWIKPSTINVGPVDDGVREVVIGGRGFIATGDRPPDLGDTTAASWVSLGGFPLTVTDWQADRITATVAPGFGGLAGKSSAELIVHNTAGVASAAKTVDLIG